MDVRELATDFVQGYWEQQVEENIAAMSNYYIKSKNIITEKYRKSFKSLLSKGIELQTQKKIEECSYIAISFLRSFIKDKDYRLRLDIYGKGYFLEKVECCEFLNVDFILKYIHEDVDMMMKMFETYGVKFKQYEIEEFKNEYVLEYIDFVQQFITQNIQELFKLEEYNLLKKAKDFKIIFGEYMDKTITIYEGTSESGES